MKTIRVFFGIILLFFAIGLSGVSLNNSPIFTDSGHSGCINRPGENDGHCETDGQSYLCANRGFLERKDCVKGVYPE